MTIPSLIRLGDVHRLCAALLLLAAVMGADAAPPAAEVPGAIFTAPDGVTMAYRLHRPAQATAKQPLPLVVYLHGNGSQGNELESSKGKWMAEPWAFNAPEVQAKHPAFVLYPRCRINERWAAVDWKLGSQKQVEQTPSQRTLIHLIDSLLESAPIDRRRVYLVGYSMGGYGTWDLLTRFPKRFCAAVALSGGGDPGSVTKDLADLPVWVFHGAKDTTVPISGSEDMVKAMQAIGATVRFDRDENASHSGTFKVLKRQPDQIMAWLLAQPPRTR